MKVKRMKIFISNLLFWLYNRFNNFARILHDKSLEMDINKREWITLEEYEKQLNQWWSK